MQYMDIGCTLKAQVVMAMRLTSCESHTGAAGVTFISFVPKITDQSPAPYTRKKSVLNDVHETRLVLSNSVLHLRIIPIASRLHALSVFLWLAHCGYLNNSTFYITLCWCDIPSENFWSDSLTSAGRTQITRSNIGSLLYVSLYLAIWLHIE